MWRWWKFVFVLLFVASEVTSFSKRVTRSADPGGGTTTPTPDEDYDDEDESEEDISSTGATGAGKIYKNPRNSPSPLCPRDEEQATLLGQKCLRKCSSDEDCKSKKKKCLCDGACGMSCIKPDRECPEPEQIAFGSVTATGKLFGSRATYSCQHGYHVVGLQSRTCQADGRWAGQPPACKQNIYCLQPPTIDHARHNALPEQATFDLDFTLQYYCHTGYVTNGFPRAKCLAIDGKASWYGPDITCEPRSCGPPPEIAHGWHAGECYTFGCRAAHRCADGYELVGRAERLCQADGTWTPRELPACVLVTAVQCPPPENPRHGKAIYTSCSYNSVVRYECDYGYTLVGESTRRCGADKKWSGSQPSCKEINCGHPGRLWNGWLENIDRGTGLGASIIFRCHHGMKLEGNSSAVCQIDGKWSYPLPKCLAPCVVPRVTKGRVILMSKNDTNETAAVSTLVEHGQVLSVDCEHKFEFLTVHSQEVMCNNGTWTQIPKCEPAKCQSLPKSPRHGMVSAPEMKHGMKAKFRCKDGYQLKGEDIMECSFGNWTGAIPKCEEVYCPYPGMVQNGKILLVGNMGLYDYRSYVKKVANNKQIMYDCDKGYVLAVGPPGATCIGGRWSPRELPKCLPGEHPRFRWNRKKRSLIMEKYKRAFIRNFQHISSQREKRFNHDFLNEPLNLFPQLKSTNYYPQTLSKVTRTLHLYKRLTCNFPTIFPHGRISVVGTFTKKISNNGKIVFGCKEGYVLEGPKMAVCTRGKWVPRIAQICVPVKQPSALQKRHLLLPFLPNLPIVRSKRSPNFNISVSRTVSEPPPELFEKMLSDIFKSKSIRSRRALKGGSSSRTVSLGHRGGSGGSLSLRRGNKNRNQYDEDQDLPDNDITSTKKPRQHKNKGPCESLQSEPFVNVEIVKHGKDQNETYGSGTVVKLACGKGYGLNLPENKTAKCVRGRWRPMKPMCVIFPCYISATEHGIFTLSKSESSVNSSLEPGQVLNETMEISNEQEVDFSCDEGYSVQGPTSLRCWHGDWVGSYPECTPAPCQLPKIYNGQYMSGYRAGLTIANGSSVTYQCDTDYSQSTKEVECFLGKLNPPNPSCSRIRGIDPDVANKLSTKTHYLGGTDIVKGGDITVIEYGSSTGKPCGPPAKVRGSLIYRNGEPLIDDENNFPDGSEVTFNCIESIMGERTTWKIICEDGSWIGRSLNCDSDELMAAQTVSNSNSTCIFRNQEENVISFYNDQQIREDVVEFPAGAFLISRCIDIGKYEMIGPNKRRCMGGEWDGPKPSCYGLNQENDYSMEKPPTILFRHQLGPIAQSNDGKLIVYPGTILHMECLWIRRFGVPKWNVSHDYRKYPEGWTADPGRDSQLEYRLSILHAAKDDSGLFTCVTPARYTHSVEIVVKAVHCPAIPQRRGLTSSTQNTKMNTKVKFYCVNGNALIGAAEILCLPSGNWSAPFPVCESIECGEVGTGGALAARVRALVVSREVGGRAVFSCEPGFGLRGASETVCQPNGEWATPFPTCEEVHCEPPTPPDNGYIQGNGPYKAGDVIQFNCNPDFMMEGQPIIACQETSRWSGKLPKCVQACSYPGTTISGRMSSVKFYYKIGENITFTCEEGLILKGAAMLKCLKNGKWSNAIPTCITDPTLEKDKRHASPVEDY